ncbi:hypothetical protein D3C85_1463800 [compost metagenome]
MRALPDMIQEATEFSDPLQFCQQVDILGYDPMRILIRAAQALQNECTKPVGDRALARDFGLQSRERGARHTEI